MKRWFVLLYASYHLSRGVLREHWARHTDPCAHIQWTCEHVVPKSIISEHNDPHNLIMLPSTLNHARSNYPYTDRVGAGTPLVKPVSACPQKICACGHLHGKLLVDGKKRLFVPPDAYKGMIGRSVLKMKDLYPHHADLIHRRVLDLGLASVWDVSFPPSIGEENWEAVLSGRLRTPGNPPHPPRPRGTRPSPDCAPRP